MNLTYKDFKIGDKVICVNFEDDGFWDQHLTIGKEYKIKDVDWHFPDKIVVKSDNKHTQLFVPIKFFADLKYERKLKLKKINFL